MVSEATYRVTNRLRATACAHGLLISFLQTREKATPTFVTCKSWRRRCGPRRAESRLAAAVGETDSQRCSHAEHGSNGTMWEKRLTWERHHVEVCY